MARKQIPLKDKKKVIKALAEGKSYEQAKEGTAVSSTNTVMRIARDESQEIAQKREIYIAKLNKAGATDDKTAKVYAEALEANKRRRDFETGEVWYEPDHKIRLDAAKYVNELKGIAKEEKDDKGNTINNFGQMILQSRQERGLE